MKGQKMDIDWRTVQMFLSEDGVCEVQIDVENNKKVRCSCPSFMSRARCKHVNYVKEHMEKNEGHYAIRIPENVPDEEAYEAMANSEAFRQFIIKYAPVEVLE